jgi:hypothetical protein
VLGAGHFHFRASDILEQDGIPEFGKGAIAIAMRRMSMVRFNP